jgi:hypothetical protein
MKMKPKSVNSNLLQTSFLLENSLIKKLQPCYSLEDKNNPDENELQT